MARHGKKQKRNVNGGKYHWELQDWVNKLYLEYPNKCVVCGTKKDLEPHHLLQVKPYDELYTSISNGVLICKECHHEYHETYGANITPYTMITFVKKKQSKNSGLQKKYKQLKKVEKYYRNETERLKKLLGEA
jgi:recombinational DNA repair protein (RecF pathway)